MLVDNLNAATELMRTVNNGSFNYDCPTILTRDGQRLNSNAVLGGTGNRAPAWDRLQHKMWLAKPRTIDAYEDGLRKLGELRHCISERAKSQAILIQFQAQSLRPQRDLEERKKIAEATLVQIRAELEEKQRLYGGSSNQPTSVLTQERRIGSRSARQATATSPAKRPRR